MIIAQIVFEFNTSLPYFSLNNLPAMEEAASKLLRKHLNTMYGSRKAFIESETNQKLRAGTRSKLQATSYAYQLGYKYIKQIFLNMIASMGDNINVGCIFTKKTWKKFWWSAEKQCYHQKIIWAMI